MIEWDDVAKESCLITLRREIHVVTTPKRAPVHQPASK